MWCPTTQFLAPGHIVLKVNREVVVDIPPGIAPRFIGPAEVEEWVPSITRFLCGGRNPNKACSSLAAPLFYIASAMQHGRGGTLLVLPKGNERYVKADDIKYKINSDQLHFEQRWRRWRKRSERDSLRFYKKSALEGEPLIILTPLGSREERDFRQAARLIAMLTAVDGATVVSFAFSVVGFGATLGAKGSPPRTVNIIDPMAADDGRDERFSKIGGTRHRSAAQFVNNHPDAFALVASQDGRLTLFANQGGVMGLRCEALILCDSLLL